eukprot:3590098-Amphidinium_carterae.1
MVIVAALIAMLVRMVEAPKVTGTVFRLMCTRLIPEFPVIVPSVRLCVGAGHDASDYVLLASSDHSAPIGKVIMQLPPAAPTHEILILAGASRGCPSRAQTSLAESSHRQRRGACGLAL